MIHPVFRVTFSDINVLIKRQKQNKTKALIKGRRVDNWVFFP